MVDLRFIADNDVVLTTYEMLRTKPSIFRKVNFLFVGVYLVPVLCYLFVLVLCCGFDFSFGLVSFGFGLVVSCFCSCMVL